MGFNFNVFSSGGGNNSVNDIKKYPNAAALPPIAADGDVAITLDTNNLYSYDTGVGGWVIIGGPGVAIIDGDTDSINMTFLLNTLTADLNLAGATTIPTGFQGATLEIYSGLSPGLVSLIPAYPIYPFGTSNILSVIGATATTMGASLSIDIAAASGNQAGVVIASGSQTFGGDKFFNNIASGFSGFGIISTGPQTIYLNSQPTIPSSYNLFLPKDIGTTWGFWQADGMGGITIAQLNLSATFLTGITGPVIATGPGVAIAVMQAGGITLSNLTGIDPTTFLGNPSGSTAGVTTMTSIAAKSILGISNTNFGDVTLGSFLYLGSAVGGTITAAQSLAFTWGDTTNPGMVGPTHQVWAGDKRTIGNLGTDQFLQFRGGSLLSLGSTTSSGVTLMFAGGQGSTYSGLLNDGRGFLSWSLAQGGFYRTVTNAGATLAIQDRFIEVTTGAANQTLNIGYAAAGNTNVLFSVQKIDSGLGTVTIQAPDGINGVTNYTFGSQWEAHEIVCNGLGFRVVN